MEVLNVLIVTLAALGSALAEPGLSGESRDYQQVLDNALVTVQRSSDTVVEVADDAVTKIEDIVNALALATAEARFSLIHVANFATNNNLTALQAMVPRDPSDSCVTDDMPAIKTITKRTGSAMAKCFTDKVREADDIHKDTVALNDQAAAIMPKALARIEKCSDVTCLETELQDILEGSAIIEQEITKNVIRAEEILSSLHSHLVQCVGELIAMFVAEVGKYASKMVACFVNAF